MLTFLMKMKLFRLNQLLSLLTHPQLPLTFVSFTTPLELGNLNPETSHYTLQKKKPVETLNISQIFMEKIRIRVLLKNHFLSQPRNGAILDAWECVFISLIDLSP